MLIGWTPGGTDSGRPFRGLAAFASPFAILAALMMATASARQPQDAAGN